MQTKGEQRISRGSAEDQQLLGWGGTLQVPSIQEIVKEDPLRIPERYIRDDGEKPSSRDICPELTDIPLIDFSLLLTGNQHERNKLESACKIWGFFQLINHGIDEEKLKEIRAAAAGFFDLPLEQKRQYAMQENEIQGYGQPYVSSEDQKLDWNDVLFLIGLPLGLRKYSCWPTIVPGFRDAFEMYSSEMKRVTIELLANLSLTMNMDKDALVELHGAMNIGTRMAYYPACSRPDAVMGISPHSDSGSITILLQDDDISALQIKHQGQWFPVKPVPSAFVVNIGDALEAWSNGLYKSIEHRAIVSDKYARLSLATFVLPENEVEIGPLDQMVANMQCPATYRKVKFGDYLRYTLAKKLEGKDNSIHALKI